MKNMLLASLSALAFSAAVPASARPLTIDDVVMLSRVSDPAVSADGRILVWQQRETDLAGNKGRFDIWKLDLSRPGTAPEKLAAEPDANETLPAFSPDGRTVYFLSNKNGTDNIWMVPAAGGAAIQVTQLRGGISGFKIAPTGDKLLIWADRKPHARSLEPAMEKKDANAGAGQTFDQMFIRHWDTWADGTRSQIFVLPLSQAGAPGWGIAVAPNLVGDTPSKPSGDGSEIDWSPDGKTIYFALREAAIAKPRTLASLQIVYDTTPAKPIEPLSTNLDIFAAPADGSAPPVNLTAANQATDTLPAVSPDGKWLAYAAMKRPGYEADRLVLMLRDLGTGQTRALTEAWDRSIESIRWAPDGRTLYVTAHDHYDVPIFAVDVTSGKVTRLTGDGSVSALVPTPKGIVFAMNSLLAPDDFYLLAGKKPAQITAVNASRLAGIDLPEATKFSFTGAAGDTVWGYALKPPTLAAGVKAPIAFVVHGGPQSSIGNAWSYRWNEALFADAGYGTVFVDFHGSIGYGQAFTDAINQDWGGKPLEDLKLGLAAAIKKFPWLDGDNACALGASYGGYMMNWIESQWPDRFKCIVQHDGVFDARAMAYETEELWFDEWEHGGHPYYEAPDAFEKWNPVNHVAKWKTPMLVITSQKDFRIPYTQGIASFTALQRREIPSRLLIFPEEGHWVLKPKDSRQWWGEVLGWLGKWTAK
jgi:dipeptidyl aminopeptidase/acylaminoacyl peptidase